jgi:hypothetical protein
MNESLTPAERDRCLLLLERALVHIRAACCARDLAKAEAIADAFHNLPRLLLESRPAWTLDGFDQLFLAGLVEQYPEFEGLRELLGAP